MTPKIEIICQKFAHLGDLYGSFLIILEPKTDFPRIFVFLNILG